MSKALCMALACWLLTSTGYAADEQDSKTFFHGRDIAPLSSYFSSIVRRVQKPFKLYHWRRDEGLVNNTEPQTNPQKYGRRIVQQEAASFVPGLYSTNRSRNMYGGGLYAALDPAATEVFGGQDPASWVLLEMQIPAGSQFLDFRITHLAMPQSEKQKVLQVLNAFSCSRVSDWESYVSQLFQSDSLSRDCADLMGHLIAVYEVDAFLYGYGSTGFLKCQAETSRYLAAVLTSNTWLNKPGAGASVLTSKTSVLLESRREIESLFRYAKSVHAVGNSVAFSNLSQNWKLMQAILADRVPEAHGQFQSFSWRSSCPNSECIIMDVSYVVDGKPVNTQVELTLKDAEASMLPSYPPTLSAGKVPLHWTDLQGVASIQDPEKLIKQNIFECADSQTLAPAGK